MLLMYARADLSGSWNRLNARSQPLSLDSSSARQGLGPASQVAVTCRQLSRQQYISTPKLVAASTTDARYARPKPAAHGHLVSLAPLARRHVHRVGVCVMRAPSMRSLGKNSGRKPASSWGLHVRISADLGLEIQRMTRCSVVAIIRRRA